MWIEALTASRRPIDAGGIGLETRQRPSRRWLRRVSRRPREGIPRTSDGAGSFGVTRRDPPDCVAEPLVPVRRVRRRLGDDAT